MSSTCIAALLTAIRVTGHGRVNERCEQPTQLRTRLEELRFRTTGRDAEFRRDFLVSKTFHVMEQEHRARPRGQLPGRFLDGLCEHAPLVVLFHYGRILLDPRFNRRQTPGTA